MGRGHLGDGFPPGTHKTLQTKGLVSNGTQLWTHADLVGMTYADREPWAPSLLHRSHWWGGSPVTRPPAGVHTPVWAFTAVLEDNGKKPVNPQWLIGELSGLILGLTFQGDLCWK